MLWSMFIALLNGIIKSLGFILSVVSSLLPSSPFEVIDNSAVSDYLGYLTWIVPMDAIISIFQLWLVSISLYYMQMIVLRWIKAID